ncbi:MAG: polysaccharide biosynthesis protein [Bacteroidetes bacterium]|nr:MAG: polysaccharide biosynthesis protein [Bacteroidota bacterium]
MSKQVKRLAKETVIYGMSNILSRLLNFIIVTPYLTFKFNDALGEYGKHGIMYAYAALLMVIMTYGMETAFFRFGNKQEDRDRTFSTAAISLITSTIVFVGILVLLSRPISGFLLKPEDNLFVILFAMIIGFDVLAAIPFARLRLENRPIRFAIYKLFNVVINLIFLLFFLELVPYLAQSGNESAAELYSPDKKLTFVFISNLIASIGTFLLLLPLYFRRTREFGKGAEPVPAFSFSFDKQLWKKMMLYAMPLVVVGIAGMANQMADRYLPLRLLSGSYEENIAQVGIYNACVKIAVLMSLFTQAFKFAAEPFFFRHAGEGGSKQVYAQVAQAFTFVGSLFFLGVLLYLDLVQYLIASNFREGLNIVPVLLLAYLSLGIYYNFSIWYKLEDKTKIGAYIAIAGLVVTLSLNFILIPKLGIIGAAWAAFACFTFMAVLGYLTGRHYYPIPYRIPKMLFYVVFAVGVYYLSTLARPLLGENLINILLVNTLLMIAYLLGVAILERKVVRETWKSFRR